MAYEPSVSTFPTAKTNLNSPAATSDTGEFDHAGLETAQNSAIDKLETAVGITGSTDTDSLTYKLNHLTASNITDVTATVTELNYVDGVTSAIQTQLNTKAPSNSPTLTTPTLTSPTITGTPVLNADSAVPFYNDSMSRQAIINGNFDVWQRGTSSTNPAHAAFLADRWKVGAVAGSGGALPTNVVHSRQALTAGDIANAFYHYRIAPDGAGTTAANQVYRLHQGIEHGTRMLCGNGKKVTISFYARSSITNKKLGFYLGQNYGTGGSPTSQETIIGDAVTLTSDWTKYTHTFTTNTLVGKTFGTANDDKLDLLFLLAWGTDADANVGETTAETFVGSGNIDIAQVQLCAGDVALPFQPKSFEEESEACRWYFEKSYNSSVAPGTVTTVGICEWKNQATTNYPIHNATFSTRKRTTPTVTLYSPATGTAGKIYNGTSDLAAGTQYAGERGFTAVVSNVSTIAEVILSYHWTADAEL